jgi:phytoene synthase
MARRDTSFYYAFLLLPARKRDAIVATWDFFRAVDDAVDEKAEGDQEADAALELAKWRAELAACYDGAAPATGQGRRLAPCVRAFRLPRRAFEAVIEGVEMDLAPRRYATFDDLYEYCLRVASAVGLVCIEIFGYRNQASQQYAIDLGVALQLTNIIRDIGRDLDAGRLYLPLEDLARFGCSEDDLKQREAVGRVRDLIAFECERARVYYDRARRGLPREDARSLVAAQVMGAIYFDLLRRIERSGYDVFSQVVRASRPRRLWIALVTWTRTMMGIPPREVGVGVSDPETPDSGDLAGHA